MQLIDLFYLAFGSAVTMLIFVHKTDIEKSKVKVRVKANRTK